MSTQFKCLLIVLASCLVVALSANAKCDEKKSVQDLIYAKYMSNTKSLFKVWHFVQGKTYDYNTEEGLRKYKNFKANLQKINEHNASKSLYKKGLNHLSDMTPEEVIAYYNLKTMTPTEVKRSLRAVNLDDFNEDEEEIPKPNSVQATGFTAIDHREYMRPVRDQGNCGSCWAFTTQAVLEGNYAKQYGNLEDWFSTQQLVDCDTSNGGCNGGWFSGALRYYAINKIVYEKDYPYHTARGTCVQSNKNTGIRVVGTASSQPLQPAFLARGPVAIAVNANEHWFQYQSGIFDSECSNSINHAVTLVGFGKSESSECEEGAEYFIIRNSWSTKWGEEGHIRVRNNDLNASSCMVTRYAFQPTKFSKS